MGNFCGNCGAPLDENANVCGKCGMSVSGGSYKGKKVKVVNPKKQKKRGIKIKLLIAFIFIAVVAVVGLKVVSEFKGSKGLVRTVMKAYEEYDINTLVSLSSNMYTYTSENYAEQYLENSIGSVLDSFETKVGHKYKFSYEVTEHYDMSERKKVQILNQIELMYPDFNINSVKEMAAAEIIVTAKQDGKTADQKITVTMTKEGDSWRWLYLE